MLPNIAIIHTHSSNYRVSPNFLPDARVGKREQQKFENASRKWRASGFTIVAPQLPSIWRAGAGRDTGCIHTHTYTHAHTQNVPPSSPSHEVVKEVSSPSQLYRLSPVIVAAPTTDPRRSSSSRSLVRSRVLSRKATENACSFSETRNFTGVALQPVGGDFPDTEICLRWEPPHPREALPTSDIDFPGENRKRCIYDILPTERRLYSLPSSALLLYPVSLCRPCTLIILFSPRYARKDSILSFKIKKKIIYKFVEFCIQFCIPFKSVRYMRYTYCRLYYNVLCFC